MNHLMPKMSRKTLIHLLLVCLLLVAYLHHFSTQIKVPATESVQFKLKPAQPSLRSRKANLLPSWAEGKKVHKSPSGPNPVGNHNPPTKQ
ncbi:CLAVATA3/ESR (CLE)-related protein 46 isoform X2 [Ricinus communis]|uniref:CLAVATA3/ESR (CLE)-related protein 46 isoform X2 n=1 Tax=Ricinus communis TaxID=3988 RepID=UPI000D68CCEE|nr:CLAVATA3/ESR (CLE)-related protein 46 isoform X2 [Ricinus communis]|eukprot:XP_025015246.1 CLAVATA3/ESR (CLE)-related protein 46 isoform X2 [Ricinus communis]